MVPPQVVFAAPRTSNPPALVMAPPVPGRAPGELMLPGTYWTDPFRSMVPPPSTLSRALEPGKIVLAPALSVRVPPVTLVVMLYHCFADNFNVPGKAFIRLLAEVMPPVMSSVEPSSTWMKALEPRLRRGTAKVCVTLPAAMMPPEVIVRVASPTPDWTPSVRAVVSVNVIALMVREKARSSFA